MSLQQGQTLKEPVAGGCLLTAHPTAQCKGFLEERLVTHLYQGPPPASLQSSSSCIFMEQLLQDSSGPPFLRENLEDVS